MLTTLLQHPTPTVRRGVVIAWFLLIAFIQLYVLPKGTPNGEWFLYGTDTVSHDLPVQMKIWDDLKSSAELPFWMPELQGGLPTLGAFLWTPAAPSNVAFGFFSPPTAQKLQFLWALFFAGLGGWFLGRVQGLRPFPSLLLGTALCLSGHLVTLIHAGHMQKILALAWLPWFLSGAIGVWLHQGLTAKLNKAAIAATALGMAFLNGHPQVAYMMLLSVPVLVLCCLLPGKAKAAANQVCPSTPLGFINSKLSSLSLMLSVVVLGLCFGAFQLMPGMEMKNQSNRAQGVSLAEATATTYPTGELLEAFFPRIKGDSSSVGYNRYVGEWGERLVSDYVGVTLGIFIIIGLFTAIAKPLSRFWLALLLISVAIGLGNQTPVYQALHTILPGFASFRSPGTFFALAAIALPALAAVGFQIIQDRFQPKIPTYLRTFGMFFSIGLFLYMFSYTEQTRWERYLINDGLQAEWESFFWFCALSRSSIFLMLTSLVPIAAYAVGGKLGGTHQLLGGLLVLCLAVDLSLANSHFLRREPWAAYQQYLQPTNRDALLMTEEKPIRTAQYDSPLSLRPILQGRDALQGYHPISYEFFLEQMRRTPPQDISGMKALGISYAFTESPEPPVAGADLRGNLTGQLSGVLWRLPAPYDAVHVESPAGEITPVGWTFDVRTANQLTLNIDSPVAGTVLLKENAAPGWQYRWGDAGDWAPLQQTGFPRKVPKPEGELLLTLRYQPRSVQLGALLSLLSGILLLIVFLATVRPFSSSNPKHTANQEIAFEQTHTMKGHFHD